MRLIWLADRFSVCRVADDVKLHPHASYCFTAKTETEHSLVCRMEDVPENTIAREDDWCGFCIEGTLDFSLIGILAKIASVLAEAKIPVFVVSTYNTDYIFLKRAEECAAKTALTRAGYEIEHRR